MRLQNVLEKSAVSMQLFPFLRIFSWRCVCMFNSCQLMFIYSDKLVLFMASFHLFSILVPEFTLILLDCDLCVESFVHILDSLN